MQTTLARALEEFWEGYTGIRPENVQIVAGDQAIAIWLEGVLSPAEQQAAGTQAGREMLGKVGERILEYAKPQLLHLVDSLCDFVCGVVLCCPRTSIHCPQLFYYITVMNSVGKLFPQSFAGYPTLHT